MIELTQIDHINMRVKNLDKSKKFYHDVFGFEEKEGGVLRNRRWTILGIPGKAYLCLYEVGNIEKIEQELQINHFGFNVRDFDRLEGKLRELGVTMTDDGPVEAGKSRSIYIVDPSGYEIELSELLGGGLN